HRYKRLPLVFIHFIDCANVGMIEGRSGAGLAAKPFQGLWVFCHLVGEKLQRDEAAEFCVLSLVNDTHAAATELLGNAVMGAGLTDQWMRPQPKAAILGPENSNFNFQSPVDGTHCANPTRRDVSRSLTATSRTPLWLVSGWGCWDRRLSRG